jgi:tripartite ATP-independent transporter DctP family solute receptor
MKRFLIAVLIVLVLGGIVFAGGAKEAAKGPVTLKFAHVYATSMPYHEGCLWAAEELAKRSNNRYKVEVFPDSQLGKESDLVQGLGMGTVDMALAGAAFLSRTYGPIALLEAPFVFRDFAHWEAFSRSSLANELSDGYFKASNGNKAVAVTYYGVRHVTANKPINVPADMKGIKIRVPDAPLYLMFPKAAGANPTPIAFAEVYLALQQGVVDAQENPLPTIQGMKFYEVQKVINLTGHMTNNLLTIIGAPLWKKLSADDQKLFSSVLYDAAIRTSKKVDEAERNLGEWFKAQGNTVNVIDRRPFMDLVTPQLTGPDATWPKEMLDRLRAIK